MLKKIILLFTLPYLVFFLLENCGRQCDRPEYREISGIDFHKDSITTSETKLILDFIYESYFVNFEMPHFTNKSFASSSYRHHECFDRLLNPIASISLISNNDFDTSHLAGVELNTLFNSIFDHTKENLSERTFDLSQDLTRTRSFNYYREFNTKMYINNFVKPTLDSIHTLFIEVKFTDGNSMSDSVSNVNLNQVFKL